MDWRDGSIVRVDTEFGPLLTRENDLITGQLRKFGSHTGPEVAFLCSAILTGDSLFDIGAHIGTFTIPMAQRAGPSGNVVAVEALPENFALLVENISANGLSQNVKAIRAVLSNEKRSYKCHLKATNSGATFFAPTDGDGSDVDSSIDLDAIIAESAPPDAIKIDIEGMELQVLQSSVIVRKTRPIIYAEVSEPHLTRCGTTIPAFGNFFRELGYRLFKNAGDRNARHREFVPIELNKLSDGGDFFDVLAIAGDSPRMQRLP